MKTYIYVTRLVKPETFDNPLPEQMEITGRHFEYLKAAMEDGTLLMAGPVRMAHSGS